MGELENNLAFIKYGSMLLGLVFGVVIVGGIVGGSAYILGSWIGGPILGAIFGFLGLLWILAGARRIFS